LKEVTLQLIAATATALLIFACTGSSGDRAASIKQKQYYIKGEQLYLTYCSNCHQKDGKGLGRLYPPIADADFIQQNPESVLCIIRFGIEGELTVNGTMYNMAMPPNPALTDLDVAQIATYILNSWGHKEGLIDVKAVSPRLNDCP
jgi:mono/diheme cytochrome c family protein